MSTNLPFKPTPLHVDIMFFYYSRAASARMDNHNSTAAIEFRCELVLHGLLHSPAHEEYSVTPKGEAWIDAILATPLPELKWVIPS